MITSSIASALSTVGASLAEKIAEKLPPSMTEKSPTMDGIKIVGGAAIYSAGKKLMLLSDNLCL